jgi:hypothetical protein
VSERDPISRLESLGSTRVPPPSRELTDALVPARLSRPEHAPRHRVLRFPVVLPAVAIAAALLGFFLVAVHHDSGSSPKAVVLENAVDASVETNGAATPAKAGATLTDGAIVSVGPTGSAKVGGVTLGPGERAVVRAGRLRRLQALRAIAKEWQQLPVAVDLTARRNAKGVVALTWSAYQGGGAAAGYAVLREDRTFVARRLLNGRRAAADRAPPAAGTRYVVIVVDAQRNPIARSQVISV